VRWVGGLGQGQQSELEQVADRELGDGDAVPVGDVGDLWVLNSSPWAIGE
jgi:hypothetical protein